MLGETFVEIKKLNKSFGDNKVLRDLDLEIREGETLAIIGKSGGGKSVLLKHIIGLLKPDSGDVFVGAINIVNLPEYEISKIRAMLFGMVFQEGALLASLTVGENVALPLVERERSRQYSPVGLEEKISKNLQLVGLKGTEDAMPAELSGGMKRRVGLARALIVEPKIILYDEPTTGLDPVLATSINELILDVKKNVQATSVVITHDLQSAYTVADRIGMLYDGKIIEIDETEKFRNSQNPIVRQFLTGDTQGPIKVR